MPGATFRYTDDDAKQFEVLKKALAINTNNKALIEAAYRLPALMQELDELKHQYNRLQYNTGELHRLLQQRESLESRISDMISD